MDARIAAHSPASVNPGMSQATRATEIPFTTRMKSPRVSTVSGRVRIRMIGRITAFTMPSSSAATTRLPQPSIRTPGTMVSATHKPSPVITGLGLWVAETIVPGVRIDGWGNLVVAALLLGIVNAVIRPIILILTLPLTVLTLGLFILVVNGVSVALVAWLMPGFALAGLWAAILTSVVVGLTSWFASAFVGGSGRIERYRRIEVTGRRLD